MSDPQGAQSRFIWTGPTKRVRDRNTREPDKERDQGRGRPGA